MSLNEKTRQSEKRRRLRRWASGFLNLLLPNERNFPTREGWMYAVASLALLAAGLYQQVNLILLVFTLTAGPVFASIFGGRSMLRRLVPARRLLPYVFSGDPLFVEYVVSNGRRWSATLALFIEESIVPVDRAVSGSVTLTPRVFFARIGGGERSRQRWESASPKRGKYVFRDLDLGTRAPFGIVEHRVTLPLTDEIVVYPKIGQLSRRWFQLQRQAMESRRGKSHDRSAQQVEYHGLRDYRSGDSPRWIHWRTTARRNELMVKEFEQHNEQDVAILVDPWLPRIKASPGQRDAVELAISFAATLCLEICRHQGRRLVLGWTGPTPGVRQGPASVKLLHELLEQLAVMRSSSEGTLAELFDVMPPPVLREAILVIVSTRSINLIEEAERSARLAGASARSLPLRVFLLNAAQGDLSPLFQFDGEASNDLLHHRLGGTLQERPSSQERRRTRTSGEVGSADFDRSSSRPGAPRS